MGTILSRVNWIKEPITLTKITVDLHLTIWKDIVYEKVTEDVAPSLDGGKVASKGIQPQN